MEILICQACGGILRSQAKSCKGCGKIANRHTSIALSHVGSPEALPIFLKNDPLVLERTVNHVLYGRPNGGSSYSFGGSDYADGNGSGNGSGGHGEEASVGITGPIAYPGYDSIPAVATAATAAIIAERNAGGPISANSQQEVEADAQARAMHGIAPTEPDETRQVEQGETPQGESPQGEQGETQRDVETQGEQEKSRSGEPVESNEPVPESSSQAQEKADVVEPAAQTETTKEQHLTEVPNQSAQHQTNETTFDASPAQKPAPVDSPKPVQKDPEPVQKDVAASQKDDAELVTALASQLSSTAAKTPPDDQQSTIAATIDPILAPSLNVTRRSNVMDFFAADTPAPSIKKPEPDSSSTVLLDDKSERKAERDRETKIVVAPEPQTEKTEEQTASSKSKAVSPSKRLKELKQSKLAKRKNQAPSAGRDDDEEDDDDEEEEDDEDDDSEKEEKDKKDRDKNRKERPKRALLSDRFNKTDEPAEKVEILGRSFAKSTLVTTGVIAFFVGFPLMVFVWCITSIFAPPKDAGSGSSPVAVHSDKAPTSMTGKWQLEYQNAGTSARRVGHGMFSLTQNGDKIEGYGIDESGSFQLNGAIQGTNARFTKTYVKDGKQIGKAITYEGQVSVAKNDKTGPVMQMLGKWELTKRQGFGWRAQVVTYSGQFGARLTEPSDGTTPSTSETGTSVATASAGKPSPAVPAPEAKDPHKTQNFFLQMALGVIGIGVLLAMVSLRFFGPSGLLNIWAKKEYIPSQFKSQHFKMVKEMGKPITTGGVPLGTREEWGLHQFWLPRFLALPTDLREKNPHMFMIGAGATGKTRLMASMIAQDIISNDRAVVVVDSDGGLADLLLNWIASRPNGAELAKRVIVVDPTMKDCEPIAFNPLELPDDGDLQNAASALMFGFKAVYTEPPGSQSQWNQQTANILRNCAVLLMANKRTLTDLPVLLSDNDFRDVMLERVDQLKESRSEFITLIDAWTNYKRLARTDQWITWIEPILNRVQPMLSDPRIRSILTKERSDLDLRRVIAEKQVLIVKIPQGQLEKNGNLLGSLMVAGLKQAALSLGRKFKHKKRPCALYLDEFESFIEKETFSAITTETRKLQIGFCGASKSLQTLPEDFRNTIVINCGMMAIFALAKKDADMLGPQMFRVDGRKVKHQTIQNVFNKVNSSPQFELIMDEEKLNIDRVVGQEKRTYFYYRVGSVAGVFRMKAPEFEDIAESEINKDLIERMHSNRQSAISSIDEDMDERSDEEDLEEDDDDDSDEESE